MPPAGRWIVIDGVDGAGKSTQVRLLAEALRAAGRMVWTTAEPSDLPIGALLRRYLRRELVADVPDWRGMALLFAADRMQHVEHEILPRVARGEVVVCDRYVASSLAYQSAAAPVPAAERPAALRWIADLNRGAPPPDLTLLLDVTPDAARGRRDARGKAKELYEERELLVRVRAQYLEVPTLRPEDNIEWIDADDSLEGVHLRILDAVGRRIGAPLRPAPA